MAFDGATSKEMYFYLRHAYGAGNLKQVFVGFDIYHPSRAISFTRPDFDPFMLMRDRDLLSRLKMILADLKLLTSFDTLIESFRTIEVGDLVLDRILGVAPDLHSDFGALLNSKSLDAYLAAVRERRGIYQAQHADELSVLTKLVTEFKEEHHIE